MRVPVTVKSDAGVANKVDQLLVSGKLIKHSSELIEKKKDAESAQSQGDTAPRRLQRTVTA